MSDEEEVCTIWDVKIVKKNGLLAYIIAKDPETDDGIIDVTDEIRSLLSGPKPDFRIAGIKTRVGLSPSP